MKGKLGMFNVVFTTFVIIYPELILKSFYADIIGIVLAAIVNCVYIQSGERGNFQE